MVYYEDEKILIRDMVQSDAQIITCEEIAQGWHQTIEKYEMRLRHQKDGKCVALAAEYKGCSRLCQCISEFRERSFCKSGLS